MVRLKCFLLLISVLLITVGNKPAMASSEFSFKHYNIDNGLSQNTVFSIFQDNLGFMWFGTKDGLNRFDGSNFKLFKFSTDSDLSDNVFHVILQDKNDNIWVSTDEGVYIYNIYKEVFYRFNKLTEDNLSIKGLVSAMVADKDGDIWLSVEGKGIFHYSVNDETLIFHSTPIVEEGMKKVSLCSDDNGVWAFPYSSPAFYIEKQSGKITEFNLIDDEEFLYHTGEVQDVFSDQKNILLIATSEKGLVSINTINKTHKILLDRDYSGEQIFVRDIEKVAPNTLLIGTETGIYIYNRLTEEVINIRHNPLQPNSLSDNAIYSIYKDRDGGVWIGSYFGGVDYYSHFYNNFNQFFPLMDDNSLRGKRVREFCALPDGNLAIGTEDGGLNIFNPYTEEFIELPTVLTALYSNIHALLQDEDYLWISTFSKGLNRYNIKTGEIVTYTQSDSPNTISQNSTFALLKDRQGILWVGTLSGLDIYSGEENRFIKVEELSGISILDIFEDSYGYIWISTFLDGLYRFNPAIGDWKIYTHAIGDETSLPYNKPLSVYEDTKRRLWVSTQGGGIGLYDNENDSFTTYNSSNGLPNDVVYQIVEDQSGFLWLSTNQGLVRFDPENGQFINFNVDNGLKTNQFNYKSSFKDSEGRIYFGSLDGFIRFDPQDLNIPQLNESLVFTDLYVNNARVSPVTKNSPLQQSIIVTEEIKLPYHQNSISLQYALLNYSHVNNNSVYYMLEGFDNDWIKSSNIQNVVYSNLSPGKYILKFGVVDQLDSELIKEIKTLKINVRPPFWLNKWAYLIYFLLLVFGLYLVFRFIKLRERLKRQDSMRKFEQEKERELYRSKINFFTNVAHEIRTPLTLIKAPLDYILMSENVNDNVDENLQIIRKNTDRLLDLTNQLLDFRKTESESYLLNLETQNVTQLINETQSRFKPLAKQKNIEFELSLPESDMFVQLDRDAFLKITSNLLSNAIKYCESYVRVSSFITNGEDQKFHFITENDGSLIPQEYDEEIFKPFTQLNTEGNESNSGTGIGLALSSSLAHLHNGTLSLENDSKANRFHLVLPVGEIKQVNSISYDAEFADFNSGFNNNGKTKENTVLLVDDDIELLQFESKVLSEYFNVILAKNGVEGIEVLKKSTVNLIVSDVMMPEMDGFEFMHTVKSNVEFSHIPIILLTAKINTQSKVQGYELGADAYLEKPFSVEVLLARIDNLLENREKLRKSFIKNPFIGAASVALTKSDEEFIKKLNSLVQENLSEPNFNVENMAEHFNMSRASFYRKVKGVLDLTPNEYIRVERLKKAAQLLKENDNKVNEVCFMVGFNSPSYFAKCFQQQFGVLPKDFQEQR